MDVRDGVQMAAKKSWLASDRRNAIVLGTGGGKSKVAIDIIKELNPSSILLLTNSQDLRDDNWRREFEKFGYDWSKVQSECYQTMYTRTGEWDLIIYDEIDFAVTAEYGKCFTNLKCKWLLGLTGFITPEKEALLEGLAPVCFKMLTQELQQTNVLNKSELVIVQYNLSKVNDITVPKKVGGTFLTSENNQYKYYDEQFQKALIVKSSIEKKLRQGEIIDDKRLASADWNFKLNATKRKSVLNNLNSSITVVKNIVANIHARPGNKVLIFSALTSQADKFGFPTYHGKSPNQAGLDNLNSGLINTLAVCKAINRGTNLIGVNYLIRESFDGSETDFNQTHGRLMRLDTQMTAKYIVLIPYYEDLVKMQDGVFKRQGLATQALRWAEKMTNSFDSSDSRTIKLDSTLTIKDGIQI